MARKNKKKVVWEPLLEAIPIPKTEAQWAEIAAVSNCTPEALKAMYERERKDSKVYKNNLYQVWVTPFKPPVDNWPEMVHLSIRRLDRHPLRDWRHFQRIKNELVGPECEGIELYPKESRLVDTANEFHLWVIKSPSPESIFPVGFFGVRMVSEVEAAGAKQRKFRGND